MAPTPTTSIPESEVNWLYGLDNKYKIYISKDYSYVYPIDLLPPALKEYVKGQNRYTDYIAMGPLCGSKNGLLWSIWGWMSLPTEGTSSKNADWHGTILALKPPPTLDELQEKLKHIKSEIDELNKLLTRYAAASI